MIITVAGYLDHETGSALRAELLMVSEACSGTLIIDLSTCMDANAEGIAVVLDAQHRSRSRTYQLRVNASQPRVADALAAVGILVVGQNLAGPSVPTARTQPRAGARS